MLRVLDTQGGGQGQLEIILEGTPKRLTLGAELSTQASKTTRMDCTHDVHCNLFEPPLDSTSYHLILKTSGLPHLTPSHLRAYELLADPSMDHITA